MNANELADALEKDPRRWTILEGAITMLRQQQAKIESLKSHPVKELTDKEILQQAEIEALKKENEELSALCVEFNVLRKAQEK